MALVNRPERHGKPWNEQETQELLQAIKRKETIQQIALKHKRSTGGINSRLRSLAADYYFNDNRPIDEIMKFTGLSFETITDAISRRQWQNEHGDTKKSKIVPIKEEKQTDITQYMTEVKKEESLKSLVSEMRDMMKEMLEIMKEQRKYGL